MDLEELEELEKNYLDERRHRSLDMKLQREDDIDAEELAAELKERYSRADYGVFRGDKDVVPQNVLIPSINDPKLSMVKVKVGLYFPMRCTAE
jgi:transcription elongation factor SPT5